MNDPHENATWVYNYDRGGNITSKVKYAYTTGVVGTALETIPYVYGDSNWKDKLTSYNGQTITYDAIGNPTNDGTWTYTWQAGRQLKQMSAEGTSVSFKYDHNGMRVQKVVEQSWYPETTHYTYHGKLLTHMTVDYTDFDEVAHQDKLHFFYDEQNRPAKVEFNGTMYTYLHNMQGDIVGLLDSAGILMVEYKYDAWGRPLSTTGTLADTLGKRNPFRYRGYVFDEETGLYYVRSRYYVASLARFLNVDGFDILTATIGQFFGSNQFQYCRNACTIAADEDGNWLNIVIGAAIGAVVSAGTQIVSNIAQNRSITDGLLTATVSGAITGGVAASGVGLVGQVVVGASVGAGAEFAQQMIDSGGDVDPLSCFIDCTVAGVIGAVGGWLGGRGLVNFKGSVYKQGTRLLNVMRNVEREVYRSASKAVKRLVKVGADYTKTYIHEAVTAVIKYAVIAALSAVVKPKLQQGSKDLLKIDVASSVAAIA